MLKYWSLIFFALAATLFSGCGYHMGSLASHDVSNIHIAMFDNDSFRRGLEVDLTNALVQEITRRMQLRVVEREGASSLLTGKIVSVRERVLTHDAENNVLSKEITIAVDFEWRNLRSGRILASDVRLSAPAQLTIVAGESVGQATADSLHTIAELIVDRMEEGNW
jgi:hypothetical protein